MASMMKASADDRGTVQSLAQDLDAAQENGMCHLYDVPNVVDQHFPAGIRLKMSSRVDIVDMSPDLYAAVLNHMKMQWPLLRFCHELTYPIPEDNIPLRGSAAFFDHAVIKQQKFLASRRINHTNNSLICVQMDEQGSIRVADLQDIIMVSQYPIGQHLLGHVRWLNPLTVDLSDTVWDLQ